MITIRISCMSYLMKCDQAHFFPITCLCNHSTYCNHKICVLSQGHTVPERTIAHPSCTFEPLESCAFRGIHLDQFLYLCFHFCFFHSAYSFHYGEIFGIWPGQGWRLYNSRFPAVNKFLQLREKCNISGYSAHRKALKNFGKAV